MDARGSSRKHRNQDGTVCRGSQCLEQKKSPFTTAQLPKEAKSSSICLSTINCLICDYNTRSTTRLNAAGLGSQLPLLPAEISSSTHVETWLGTGEVCSEASGQLLAVDRKPTKWEVLLLRYHHGWHTGSSLLCWAAVRCEPWSRQNTKTSQGGGFCFRPCAVCCQIPNWSSGGMMKSRIALGLGDTPEASSSSLQRFSSYMSKYLMKEFTVIHVLELLGDKFLV